jgi:cytidine deaminase
VTFAGEAPAVDWEALTRAAVEVQGRAHAPYSGYPVGAALITRSGRVFAGCNVENATFGLTVCAERSAIVQMVSAGERDPVAITVVTRGPVAAAPCGMCRQTLAEFAVDLHVLLVVAPGGGEPLPPRMITLSALLPDAFRSDALRL